jgi:uncharacterized protein YydD (DUF2326 family)
MIRSLRSSLPSFKGLDFRPGLNILVADTTPESSERQTRNRAGKSSLVEVAHFLTGGSAEPSSIFRNPALVNHTFEGEMDIGSDLATVARSGARPSRVAIGGLRPEGQLLVLEGPREISNEGWKEILGARWFALPSGPQDVRPPSFRSLFAYFARRDAGGGFQSPFKHFTQQSLGDQQVAMSYLLGLDWTIPAALDRVRDKEAALRVLRDAASSAASAGAIAIGPRPSGQLRSLLAVAEERAQRIHGALATFRVLPEYEQLQQEADALTGLINDAANASTSDLRQIARLREALNAEAPPSMDAVVDLYAEAGTALPGVTLRRLDDVRAFHESVIANRKAYLDQELASAEERMRLRTTDLGRWDERRSAIIGALESHGALSQFAALQEEASRLDAQVATLREEFRAAEQIEGTRTELEIERTQLARRLHQDFVERAESLRRAILTFEEVSSALYEEAGRLEIAESANGPTFEVTIQGGQSHGVRNMQIFCMDMTILRIAAERGIGPGFLIHDSHLFDGVDERQVARALKIGSDVAEELGLQYIVTLNSDALPTSIPANFDLPSHYLPVRLTDQHDEGGLFGLRF